MSLWYCACHGLHGPQGICREASRATVGFADEPTEAELVAWPNCTTPDCEHKSCQWAGLGLCHPCSVRVLGRAEVDRRYAATHPNNEWNGEVAR